MPTDHRSALASIKRFDQLIAYLRDELGWPIARDSFEDVDDLFYDFTADELGIDPKTAAKIESIKRLRPLSPRQPWGIFFIKFEPKRLPVVALRRILSQVALKKRASANSAERTAWAKDDLLFVSNYGVGDDRHISFAHFSTPADGHDLPTLKVLGWDNRDTALHLDAVARELTEHLAWPDDDRNAEAWRTRWRAAFTLGHREVVATSKDLSIRLAELARSIRDRIQAALAFETEKGPLTRLMKAFQEALVDDLDADGFADMYAQTISYGLLSARIADPHRKTADDFAAHMRTNPFLRELMETFLRVGGRRGKAGGPGIDFDELGVSEVVELLDDANMEAVVRDFGDRNPEEDPVIHFYELFLKEYDAKKRLERGVFYTPRPVVSYIVRSVDELLRTEFGLDDGLADTATWGEMARRHKGLNIPDGVSPDQEFVQILDPATGTGTFLVETIDHIHRTLVAKWTVQGHREKEIDALWNEYVPRHLLTRLHGYELLMAPYAIAHLKIGLKLFATGYRFGCDERARVFLTNALEPARDSSGTFRFALPALAHEAAAVNDIKRHRRFTVVVGNPPYSNFGQLNRSAFILGLLGDYKRGLDEKKLNLDDDYLKFWRFAQYILRSSSCGAIGLITNSSYLDGLVHRKMRESLLAQFSAGFIVDLHGNSRRGDVAPDGSADENVFDIQQGVAIAIWGLRPQGTRQGVHYSEMWGDRGSKYSTLSTSTVYSTTAAALEARPPQFFFIGQSGAMREEYEAGVPLGEVFTVLGSGLNTDRDELCIDFDRAALSERMKKVFAGQWDAQFVEKYNLRPSSSYDPVALAKRQSFDPEALRPCLYRPFDWRSIYYKVGFTSRPVFDVQGHMLRPNVGLLVCRQSKEPFAVLATRHITTHKIVAVYDRTSLAPLWLYPTTQGGQRTLGGDDARIPSFGPAFVRTLAKRLGSLPGEHSLPSSVAPEDVFYYAYAVFHSPTYRARYAEFLKSDFPRLPLTGSLALFRTLARLGGELVALHLLESKKVDRPSPEYVGGRAPVVEGVSWSKNTVWLDKAYTTGFRGVPAEAWAFHIGGYQVCEKWLKDRKGRSLSKDDIALYQRIVVALAETTRLMKEIDVVIERHGGWPGAFEVSQASVQHEVEHLPRAAESSSPYGSKSHRKPPR